MSFSGTPLGQGRRLDRSTFLGKSASDSANSLQSYAYGAPAFGSRSPPKPTSPPKRDRIRPQVNQDNIDENENEPALIRFARLKQRETAPDLSSRPGGPKVITSPPKPEKWSVKDTSVNIATAFIQAATGDMSATQNHNGASAASSSSSRPVPRSTSVEFESRAPAHTTANRRLAPPPNKLSRPPVSTTGRKPASKTSYHHVPESDGEEDRNVRGKSPFELSVNMAKQAIGAAAFYVRQRSHEPEDLSREDNSQELPPANGRDGNDSSYSYTQEERSYQAAQKKAAHRKARMSEDNKAYKPALTEEESSEESDDGKSHKKRKSKKSGVGGPLTSLPVVTSGKRRKKRRPGTTKEGGDGGADDFSGSDDDETMDMSQSAQLRASVSRTSNPPLSHASASRLSREPQDYSLDTSASMNLGLESIPEIADEQLLAIERAEPIRQSSQMRRSRSRTPAPIPAQSRSPAFSIGGLLGKIVHLCVKLCLLVVSGVLSVMSMLTFLFGQVFGTSFDILLRRPVGWARGSGPLLRLLVPAAVVFAAWFVLQNASLAPYVPSLSFPTRTPTYQPPAAPPANMGQFSDRLTNIEAVLSGLSADNKQAKRKTEENVRRYSELMGQVTSLDSRLAQEIRKTQDANIRAQNAVNVAVSAIKHEMEVLQSQMAAQQKQHQQKDPRPHEGITDEEARLKLKSLEERFAAVEGSSKEALELAKKAQTVTPPAAAPALPGVAWWNKLASGTGSKSLQIKSADGQDVSALITHLVDSAVSRINKDGIAKADFAMQSSGARVIPSLTSPALELKPKGFANQVVGLFTGKGYFGFRSPITALHYDIHTGVCWPFAGEEGQLGVMLVAPVYIEEITIDHVAKEIAFDMGSAPRHMEVWGMIEGADNAKRVADWRAEREARGEAGEKVEPEVAYPPSLPKSPEYVRIANFTYDIEAPNNIQTFPVDPEIRNLGIDFGIVVLRVLDNWGRKEYTCLYRFRVHGQRMGEIAMPYADISESS